MTDKVQELFSINNRKSNIMHVGDTILDVAAESSIDENWCLLDNKSTCNAFINDEYLSNTRDDPDGKYLRFHFNTGVNYTNNIG